MFDGLQSFGKKRKYNIRGKIKYKKYELWNVSIKNIANKCIKIANAFFLYSCLRTIQIKQT